MSSSVRVRLQTWAVQVLMAVPWVGCSKDPPSVSTPAPHPAVQPWDSWKPPRDFAGLRQHPDTADKRDDLGVFQELVWSKCCKGSSIEYRFAAPGALGSVVASIGKHLDPRWIAHDFSSVWTGLRQRHADARFYVKGIDGQTVLESTWTEGEGTRVAVMGWVTSTHSVIVQSTIPDCAPSNLLVRDLLRHYRSSLTKEYSQISARDFVVAEVDRCVERLPHSEDATPIILQLAGLTFFMPSHTQVEGRVHVEQYRKEFTAWWAHNRHLSQDQRLRQQIGRLTEEVATTRSVKFPSASVRISMSLESITGFRLPPRLLQNSGDLEEFKRNVRRFWSANKERPRREWIREAIDIWITYLESLPGKNVTPGEAAADCVALENLGRSTGKMPEALQRFPTAGLNAEPEVYFAALKAYLAEFRSWWKRVRDDADGSSRYKPLYEEQPAPVFEQGTVSGPR